MNSIGITWIFKEIWNFKGILSFSKIDYSTMSTIIWLIILCRVIYSKDREFLRIVAIIACLVGLAYKKV